MQIGHTNPLLSFFFKTTTAQKFYLLVVLVIGNTDITWAQKHYQKQSTCKKLLKMQTTSQVYRSRTTQTQYISITRQSNMVQPDNSLTYYMTNQSGSKIWFKDTSVIPIHTQPNDTTALQHWTKNKMQHKILCYTITQRSSTINNDTARWTANHDFRPLALRCTSRYTTPHSCSTEP